MKFFYLLLLIMPFASCKKKYSCACSVYIHYFRAPSPAQEVSYTTSSYVTIDKKMTHKKAISACKEIQNLFLKRITPVGDEYYIVELTGGCELK